MNVCFEIILQTRDMGRFTHKKEIAISNFPCIRRHVEDRQLSVKITSRDLFFLLFSVSLISIFRCKILSCFRKFHWTFYFLHFFSLAKNVSQYWHLKSMAETKLWRFQFSTRKWIIFIYYHFLMCCYDKIISYLYSIKLP